MVLVDPLCLLLVLLPLGRPLSGHDWRSWVTPSTKSTVRCVCVCVCVLCGLQHFKSLLIKQLIRGALPKYLLTLYLQALSLGLQVYQLYVVLIKKRDPITQTSFLDNISEVSITIYIMYHSCKGKTDLVGKPLLHHVKYTYAYIGKHSPASCQFLGDSCRRLGSRILSCSTR